MSHRDTGIYLSKRTVYITIAVSLGLNAFFLMMGILIGKDDSKWDQQQIVENQIPKVQSEPGKKDNLDSELAHFQPVDESKPPKPLDLNAAKPQVTSQPPPVKTTPPAEKPKTTTVETPSKTVPKETKPAPTKPAVSKSAKELASGYWVQVLATDNASKANQFKNQVNKLGYPATIIKESPYFKVLVGPHANANDAKRAKDQINQRFKSDAWIREI